MRGPQSLYLGGPMDLNHIFTYHPPTEEQKDDYYDLRESAKAFARTIIQKTPDSADQTAAIRLVREALMTANAAIALDGRL